MLKIVTLMKRRAGLSVEEFQNHLRNTTARWRRKGRGYAAMCNPLRCRKVMARASSLFDAIGEMWLDSAHRI